MTDPVKHPEIKAMRNIEIRDMVPRTARGIGTGEYWVSAATT
jgi:hypothetical protein